ncbi:uncharacterized protein DS421_20g704800 [Arachis hypogaea]|nr:uncharacterized protein DS421_20g704800 [Arachis hypogaea]
MEKETPPSCPPRARYRSEGRTPLREHTRGVEEGATVAAVVCASSRRRICSLNPSARYRLCCLGPRRRACPPETATEGVSFGVIASCHRRTHAGSTAIHYRWCCSSPCLPFGAAASLLPPLRSPGVAWVLLEPPSGLPLLGVVLPLLRVIVARTTDGTTVA